MKVENWRGYDIRFVEYYNEWYAVLKDVCDAMHLSSRHVSERLSDTFMERVPIETDTQTYWMLAVNETGIYEALFASKRLEARKFRRWSSEVLQKLRRRVGLESYQALQLMEPEIQEEIDFILDSLFWDEEAGKWMQSVTVQGGDVEQVEFK